MNRWRLAQSVVRALFINWDDLSPEVRKRALRFSVKLVGRILLDDVLGVQRLRSWLADKIAGTPS